jgi:hypothetical protein
MKVETLTIQIRLTAWGRIALWFAQLLDAIGVQVDPDRVARYLVRNMSFRTACGLKIRAPR